MYVYGVHWEGLSFFRPWVRLAEIKKKCYLSIDLSGSISRKNSSSCSTVITGPCNIAIRNWRAGVWPSRKTAYKDARAHLPVLNNLKNVHKCNKTKRTIIVTINNLSSKRSIVSSQRLMPPFSLFPEQSNLVFWPDKIL